MAVTARLDGPTQTPAGGGSGGFSDVMRRSGQLCGEERSRTSASARVESLRYCDRDKRGGVFLMPEKSDCKNWSAKSCHVMTAREQRGQVLLLRPRKEGPTPAVRGTWGEAPQRRQRRPRGGGAGDGGGVTM